MPNTTIRRDDGIPGSNAAERVAAMGGPIAQRASRKTTDGKTADGPGFIDLRTRSSRRVAGGDDDVQVVTEDPPDSDSEEWVPPRMTIAERVQRVAEERARTTEARPVVAPRSTTSGSIPARRRTEALPRQRRRLPDWTLLWLGALVLIALYLVIGWLYVAGVGISNRLNYGPTPTSYLEAVVGDHDAPGHPTCIVAMNVHGTIVIQVAPGGDFTRSSNYILATLDPRAWGNLDDVVVTLTVSGGGSAPNILVHLQGDPDLSHFYYRPSATLLLINQHPGFKAGLVQ